MKTIYYTEIQNRERLITEQILALEEKKKAFEEKEKVIEALKNS